MDGDDHGESFANYEYHPLFAFAHRYFPVATMDAEEISWSGNNRSVGDPHNQLAPEPKYGSGLGLGLEFRAHDQPAPESRYG